MATDRVRRDLRVTTPFTEGADIEALQEALNGVAARSPKLLEFRLGVDGKFGEKTLAAALKTAHLMGVIRPRLNLMEKQHVVFQSVQRVIRQPDTRTAAQKRRARERREDLRKKLSRRPSLERVQLTRTAGQPHWGGSNDVVTQFVEPLMVQRGLPIGSGKRTPAHNAAIGGSATSDHLTTKTTTAARDFPTFAGEDDARALARAMEISTWKPNDHTRFSITAGGGDFEVQILWGAAIDHGDHVHVGVRPA